MSDRTPFPMPEPMRSAAVLIIVEVARRAQVPPAYLTAHIMDSPVMQVIYAARREAQRRILAEVPGCSRGMLARAFGRDLRRLRASEISLQNAGREALPPSGSPPENG